MKQADQVEEAGTEETAGETGSRLSRWSRRKQASRVAEDDPGDSVVSAAIEAETEEPEPQPLTDDDMPPLESLTEESDYRGFLSPKVSDELRKLALRKLFHGSKFNICDGLDDYDEDFTKFAKLGDVITAEMRRRTELEALKKLQQEGADPQVVEGASVSDVKESVAASIDEGASPLEKAASVEDETETKIKTEA